MLEIDKINNIFLPLGFRKALEKAAGEVRKSSSDVTHPRHRLQDLIRIFGSRPLSDRGHGIFGLISKKYGGILLIRIHIRVFFGADGRQPSELYGECTADPFPDRPDLIRREVSGSFGTRNSSESAQRFHLFSDQRKICRRTVRQRAERAESGVNTLYACDLLRSRQDHILHPGSEQKGLLTHDRIIRAPQAQPLSRIRPAHRLCVQSLDHILDLFVPRSAAEIVRAEKKGRIFLFISLLEELFERIFAQKPGFRLVHLPESGIQIDLTEIVAQHEGEKTVHRRALRIVKQCLLPLQVEITGVLFDSSCDGGADPLPHLRCCRLSKGDHEESVNIERMISLTDHADDPLDKNGRLAAAGRRRDQYIVVSGVKDPHLLFRKSDCHRFASLICLCSGIRQSRDQIRRHFCRDSNRKRTCCFPTLRAPPPLFRPGSPRPVYIQSP